MKQQQKCSECGKEYWVTMIRVFVFKQHTCLEDKTALMPSSSGEIFTCPVCKKEYNKSNPVEYNNMGTRILGSTRDLEARDKRLYEDRTLVADKVMVPEETSCQKCRNLQNRYSQANKKRERKLAMGVPDDIRALPATITDADVYKHDIFQKTQQDYQEARKAEAYAQQKAERARLDAERRAKLAEQMKRPETLLPTKEEMKPLIDPETAKLIEEVKKKDAHIAELKRKLEEAKKIEDNKAKAKGAAKVLNGEK